MQHKTYHDFKTVVISARTKIVAMTIAEQDNPGYGSLSAFIML